MSRINALSYRLGPVVGGAFLILLALVPLWLDLGRVYVDGDFSLVLSPAVEYALHGDLYYPQQDIFADLPTKKLVMHMPFHYLLVGTAFKLFGVGISQAQVIATLEGGMALAAIFALGLRLGGVTAGFLSLLFASSGYSLFASLSTHGRPDMLCAALGLVMALCFVEGVVREKGGWFFASGVVAALSFLSHGNGIVYFAVAVAGLTLLALRGEQRLALTGLKGGLLGAVGPLALYLLWLGGDLYAIVEQVFRVYFSSQGNWGAAGLSGTQHLDVTTQGPMAYLTKALAAEWSLRYLGIAQTEGALWTGLILVGVVGYLLAPLFAQEEENGRNILRVMIVTVALFMLLRNNKSLSYAYMLIGPVTVAAGVFYGALLVSLAGRLGGEKGRYASWGGMVILVVTLLSIQAGKVEARRAMVAPFVDYDRFGSFLDEITGKEGAILGDHRLWFGLRHRTFDSASLMFERLRNAQRPLAGLMDYEWLILSEAMDPRLTSPEGMTFIRSHFVPVADIAAYPYSHIMVFHRGALEEPLFRDTLPYPLTVSVTDREMSLLSSDPTRRSERRIALVAPGDWTAGGEGAVVTVSGERATITTGPSPYGYAASSPLYNTPKEGDLVVRLQARVSEGGGGVGALSEGGQRWLANQAIPATGAWEKIELVLPQGEQGFTLVAQNNNPGGGASRYELRAVTLNAGQVLRLPMGREGEGGRR